MSSGSPAPIVASVTMGYGHLRAAHPLAEQLGVPDPMAQLGAKERAIAQEIRLGRDGEVTAAVKLADLSLSGQIRLTPRRSGNDLEGTCTASQEIWKYITATCRN